MVALIRTILQEPRKEYIGLFQIFGVLDHRREGVFGRREIVAWKKGILSRVEFKRTPFLQVRTDDIPDRKEDNFLGSEGVVHQTQQHESH